jgi:hypothetical protein
MRPIMSYCLHQPPRYPLLQSQSIFTAEEEDRKDFNKNEKSPRKWKDNLE